MHKLPDRIKTSSSVSMPEKVEAAPIGKCPRCGREVIEGRKGFGCVGYRDREKPCSFAIWKNNPILATGHKSIRRPSRKEASNSVPEQKEMQIMRWKRSCATSLSIPGQTAITMEKGMPAMNTDAASMTAEPETAAKNKRERISAKPAERITAALSTTAHSLTLLMIAENLWSMCAVPV